MEAARAACRLGRASVEEALGWADRPELRRRVKHSRVADLGNSSHESRLLLATFAP